MSQTQMISVPKRGTMECEAKDSAGAAGGPDADDAHTYRFDRLRLRLVLADMRFGRDDLGPSNKVPTFDLPTVSGRRFRSADLAEFGPALMVFGSSTCPVTDDAAAGLRELHSQFGDRVRFVMVNVREAHPGNSIPQPSTMRAKTAHALMLRTLHDFPFDVAVDDIEGSLHRAFGPKPNSAYIIGRDGTIRFRAHWASDATALGRSLAAVVAGRDPRPRTVGGVLRATIRMIPHLGPVLDRAGRSAWLDMWRIAPPLAAAALVLKLLRVVPADTPRDLGELQTP